MIWGLDPGPKESALVCLSETDRPRLAIYEENARIRTRLYELCKNDTLCIEMVANMGMPAGESLFETCVQIGRFIQTANAPFLYVYRREVKLYLCGSSKANDATVRQALIDRYGGIGGSTVAIGKKSCPGPLYGVKGDIWSALAIALTGKQKVASGLGNPSEQPRTP